MSTERLIDDLVSGLKPARSRSAMREGVVYALICGTELALFLLFGAARHDIALAMRLPSFWWRLGGLGALTVISAATAIRSFEPTASPRRGLRWLSWATAAVLLLGWVIDAVSANGGGLLARLMWRHGVDCVFTMVVLSIPAIVALGLFMRRGAPTDREGSALSVGAAGACWGAFVFAFNCSHDDPFYIAVWYMVGCSIVALVGRIVLPLIARW